MKAERRAQKAAAAVAAHADDQDGEEPQLAQPARKRITNYALNVGTRPACKKHSSTCKLESSRAYR